MSKKSTSYEMTPEKSAYYKELEEHRPLPAECWVEGCPVPYESDEERADRLQHLYDMGIDPYKDEW